MKTTFSVLGFFASVALATNGYYSKYPKNHHDPYYNPDVKSYDPYYNPYIPDHYYENHDNYYQEENHGKKKKKIYKRSPAPNDDYKKKEFNQGSSKNKKVMITR